MISKTNPYTNNYSELKQFLAANGVIIVHPNKNIIAKVAQKLQKTK